MRVLAHTQHTHIVFTLLNGLGVPLIIIANQIVVCIYYQEMAFFFGEHSKIDKWVKYNRILVDPDCRE